MWDLSLFKTNAKIPLKYTYWNCFGVCLVTSILVNLLSTNSSSTSSSGTNINYGGLFELINPFALLFFLLSIFTVFAFSIIGIGYELFIVNPLRVGQAGFFVKNRSEPAQFPDLFMAFKSNYINTVKVMGLRYLYIFLWSLLLIIPGIIKQYAYFCVPYLMAEEPDMSWRNALAISEKMTSGRKMDLWILDLSFIGWYILGAFALGVGVFFVYPYHEATKAEAFQALKQSYLNRENNNNSQY